MRLRKRRRRLLSLRSLRRANRRLKKRNQQKARKDLKAKSKWLEAVCCVGQSSVAGRERAGSKRREINGWLWQSGDQVSVYAAQHRVSGNRPYCRAVRRHGGQPALQGAYGARPDRQGRSFAGKAGNFYEPDRLIGSRAG